MSVYHLLCRDHVAVTAEQQQLLLQVTDASGARLDFAGGRWLDLDGGIIAAPPVMHAAVLEAVQTVRSTL